MRILQVWAPPSVVRHRARYCDHGRSFHHGCRTSIAGFSPIAVFSRPRIVPVPRDPLSSFMKRADRPQRRAHAARFDRESSTRAAYGLRNRPSGGVEPWRMVSVPLEMLLTRATALRRCGASGILRRLRDAPTGHVV
jgi:hypothetical protein